MSQEDAGAWESFPTQRARAGVLTGSGGRSPSTSASDLRSLGSRTAVREGCLQENGWGEEEGWLGQNQPLLPRP